MTLAPAPWRDRDRLQPLLVGWRALAVGRAMHRVATGGSWVSLQLAGSDRLGLFLGALPGAVLVFPFAAPLPPALHAALRPVARNPLVDLLAGARLLDVSLLAGDLVLQLRCEAAGGVRLLRHQLFGSRGGTVLLDADGRMLWSAHASPHPCLLDPGARLAEPAEPTESADTATATPADLAAWTATGLHRLARQQETQLADRLQRRLERGLSAAERLVANLAADLQRADDGQQRRRDAETLAAYLHTVARGTGAVTLTDPHDGSPRTIELDPSQSAAANLERLFRLARKAARGRQVIADRLAEASGARAELATAVSDLAPLLAGPQAEDTSATDHELAATLDRLAALQAFRDEHQKLLPDPRQGPASRAPEEPARPFRRFLIDGRWEAWVGRSSKENDELTHRASAPRDLWLHAQGSEGSHVILRTGGKPEAVPRAVLEQAAALAAAFSKARHSGLAPVLWTERRYVRRPRKSPPGTAVCQRAESIMVEPGIKGGVEPA